MHWFSTAVVANHHKQSRVNLMSSSPKWVTKATVFSEGYEEKSVSLTFPVSRSHFHSLARGPFLHFQSSSLTSSSIITSLFPTLLPPTTGPLHMLAPPPGMMVFLLFFSHSPFSSYLMMSSETPLWFPWLANHPHCVLMNIMSSLRGPSHRFGFVIIWLTAASITRAWALFWQEGC